MSTVRKTIVFFLSLFSTIAFLSIVSLIISPMVLTSSDYVISNIVYPIFFTLGLIFFLIAQAFVRFILNRKLLSKEGILLTVSAEGFNITEKLWLYLFTFLIYFAPVISNLSFELITLPRIMLFLISLGLIEYLIRLSGKRINIHFLRNGIIISGFDIRVELPIILNTNIHNDSGYYSYNDIESYFIFPDYTELYLILERGKIAISSNEETKRQIKGLLIQQKIEMKKFS